MDKKSASGMRAMCEGVIAAQCIRQTVLSQFAKSEHHLLNKVWPILPNIVNIYTYIIYFYIHMY